MENFSENSIHIKLERVLYRYKVPRNYKCTNRDANGFIYYVKGGHRFDMTHHSISAQDGDFVYLPYNSSYTNNLLSADTEYYQVDFLLYNNGKPVSLFDDIQIIKAPKSNDHLSLIKEIYSLYFHRDSAYGLTCIGNICRLINMMTRKTEQEQLRQKGLDTISKSLSFIKEHYNEETSIDMLAELSHISVSNLEKTFKRCFGVTPIVYRNNLRIEEAKKLLANGFTIAETCEKVGIPNYYYFCKAFKKHTGISPGAFISQNSRT